MESFCHQADQRELCQVLRALIEEWGPESVVVGVPRQWRRPQETVLSLGQVQLEYCTECTVCFHVEYNGGRLNYEAELAKI